jgi:hypothetical protein
MLVEALHVMLGVAVALGELLASTLPLSLALPPRRGLGEVDDDGPGEARPSCFAFRA